MVDVAVICGSASDSQIAEKVFGVLREHGVSYDYQVISAHRDPERLDEYIKGSDARVFIAIAGLSAALPGVIASKTARPVIGVPVSGKLMGLDALLSIVQMPRGVPVACVGVDNGENAAHLAIRILNARSA
ncbi:5-(carboxyamino)imidazole ribonucleotide mutase [Methanoculleus thermophilus]|jgi:5-(carboxyamino)imidazole ribonucleotide mutase|uniref:N5-carboxyaminoimidazole ribonucleotide mutase n=1 Tax=Methanoculleus thermophilus TaxID=2200 RepID=A0A1G9A1H1_9EURY|nr:5-(carboxyamino)imidazole ribonucleotide mutase [Methanoculleus thermophilus]NLN08331.1 5-(carboxyamino)imidazole ribonucleotide mutase [Methanoculleus thermophilus]SDK20240.1 5-(carboxyamino)imidazole ribonucleotide mutase [Methanoculleus thermophilus]HQD27020.1 5-(carboxyamino)imidazole ribonucleotide mutase [Methanoculleus thermophilus]